MFLKASESLYFLVFFTVYISCFIILKNLSFSTHMIIIKKGEIITKTKKFGCVG